MLPGEPLRLGRGLCRVRPTRRRAGPFGVWEHSAPRIWKEPTSPGVPDLNWVFLFVESACFLRFKFFSSQEAKRKAHNFGGVNVLVHPENGFGFPLGFLCGLKGGHH